MALLQVDPTAVGVVGGLLAGLLGLLYSLKRERKRQKAPEERPDSIRIEAPPKKRGEALRAHRARRLEQEARAHESALRRLEPCPAPRYANVWMASPAGERRVEVGRDRHAVIRLAIGPLRTDSKVEEPVPFPDRHLPQEDLQIRVLLSSAGLDVGLLEPGDRGNPRAVEQSLFLPAGGGPAFAADGGDALQFALALPRERNPVRARLSYFYRDTVVQSQRLDLEPDEEAGEQAMRLRVRTDFTISAALDRGLEQIVERPRVSIFINDNSPNEHEVTVRGAGDLGAPVAFRIDDPAVAKPVAELREQLRLRAPVRRERKVRELTEDLRRLAPLGALLFQQIPVAARRVIRTAPAEARLQIATPKDSSFTLPWNLIYDIPIDSEAKLGVCPVVEQLGRGEATIDPGTRECPHPDHPDNPENLLCPFGFWGMRKSIEVLTFTREPRSTIKLGEDARVVFGQTQHQIDRDLLADHIATLTDCFRRRSPGVSIHEAKTKQAVREGLTVDLPIVYFLCHGTREGGVGPTRLGVGEQETITPGDFENWVELVFDTTRHRLWTDPRPLVFVNACQSMAIAPEDLAGYLGAFVGNAQAVGVIGTEARVNPTLAMDVGEQFFEALLHADATVDEALRTIKANYLTAANLFGLVYTPYCFADLKVA